MAEPALVQSDKARWCRERLEFVCAVVNGVDRDSLKDQLEICETDDEAEGLMQSLLWQQDQNNRQVHHPVPGDQNPREPEDRLLPEDQNHQGPGDLQLLPENQYQERPLDRLLPENQYQQRPLDFQLLPGNQNQQRPQGFQPLPQDQNQQRPEDLQLLLENEFHQRPPGLQLLPEDQNEEEPENLQGLPEHHNQEEREILQVLLEDQNQEELENVQGLLEDHNQEEQEILQVLLEDQNQEELENVQGLLEDHNQEEREILEVLLEDQNQEELEILQALLEDQHQEEPEILQLSPEDQNRREPRDQHDPRHKQRGPQAPELFSDEESDPEEYEDAAQSPLIPNARNGGTGTSFPPELEGAVGGVGPNYEDTEGDERLARRLANQIESEDTTGDEELARRLAGEGQTDSEDSDADFHLPREVPEDVVAEAEAEADAREGGRSEEDVLAERAAFLANMFPDAEPQYLRDRCKVIRREPQAFEQLVEELLQMKKTEPRMSGYLRRQRQAMLTKRSSDFISEEDSTWVFLDPEQDVTANEIHECPICYEEEVFEKNMATCNAFSNYHKFCIDCIRKHVAALIGQGLSNFKCMNGYCKAEFSWRTLKRVMEPVVFQKIQERKQQDEITAAGIENLESCPFCNFMIIMPNQGNKVLECLNPECLQESCRLCKEPSHIPYRCEEIEKEGQKNARTNIENQMAEAMIRECPQCKKRFIIEAGCNRMACPCGAIMCYLCKKLITNDYHHFERGQIQSNKCPLWSNATELHASEVRAAAARAKQELDSDISLVHDPTADLQ